MISWGMRILILVLALLMSPLSLATTSAEGFFKVVNDLPLMEGLRDVPDAALLYDKPEGRIVELLARGQVSENKVREFYARTLPQLGWKRRSDVFVREGEVLSLKILKENGELAVYLSINPQ
jgi:hypothetical protein